jgi:hypothetical protein
LITLVALQIVCDWNKIIKIVDANLVGPVGKADGGLKKRHSEMQCRLQHKIKYPNKKVTRIINTKKNEEVYTININNNVYILLIALE